jgi:hypothetical protein
MAFGDQIYRQTKITTNKWGHNKWGQSKLKIVSYTL